MYIRWLLIVLLVCLVITTNANENLYKILGVGRQADTHEIKKAYKKLAREWHPDKNSDPSANEKFMKINEAYETLSDAQKRSDYDNYGTTAGQAQSGRQPHNDFDAFFQRAGGFPFDNFRFNFDRGDKNHINFIKFENTILPESNTRPFLIYAYTDFCFQCMQVHPIWQQMSDDLEKIGMGVATMNANIDGALVRKLRLNSVPAVIGVVSGKLHWFSKPFNIQNLRDFVRSILPSSLIAEVTESSTADFLSSWTDNRVRMLMFDTRKQPCLRYLMSAFAFRERVAAGYVNTNFVSRNFLRKYKISSGQENLLVFKEDVENPTAQISMKSISRSTMDEVIESNKFLVLPRLSNQATFDYLCPVRSLARDRKLCVLLLTRNAPSDDGYRNSFRQFAHSHMQTDDRINFAYVYEDTQSDLVKTLTWGQGATNSTFNTRKVAVVWRKTESRLLFDHLSEGWYSSDQPITDQDRSRQRLNEMIDWCLQSGDVLSFRVDLRQELYNEHQAAFIVRILESIYNWKDILWEKFISMDEMMMITMVCTALMVMLIGLMFGGIASTAERAGDPPSRANRTRRGHSSTQSSTSQLAQPRSINIHPLTEENYESLIANAQPGSLLILVLVEGDSQAKLLKQFASVAYPYLRSSCIPMKFSYVSMDHHLLWYRRLLESTSNLPVQDFSSITGHRCAGTVLAINGSKNYYCLYHAPVSNQAAGGAAFLGLDDDNDDDVSKQDVLFIQGLGSWFERLSEGMLTRYKVTKWPQF